MRSGRPGEAARVEPRAPAPRGWKRYWHHVVATGDGAVARLFHNGELVAERALDATSARLVGDFLEAAAYLGRALSFVPAC